MAQKALALLDCPIPATRAGRLMVIARETTREVSHRLFGAKALAEDSERAVAQELLTLIRGTSDAFFIAKGRLDEAFYLTMRALHAAEAIDDPTERMSYLAWFGFTAYAMPLHSLGRYYFRLAGEQLPRASKSRHLGNYYAIAGYMHSAEGRWQEALSDFTQWIQVQQKANDEAGISLALRSRAPIWLVLGRLDEVAADGEDCLRLGKRLGNSIVIASALLARSLATYYRGDWLRGFEILQEGVAQTQLTGSLTHQLYGHGLLAQAACRAGKLDLAAEQLSIALRGMARTKPPTMQYFEGYSGVIEAALHLWQAAPADASRHIAERSVRQALWQMARYSFIFPVGRPRMLIGLGRYLALRSKKEWAVRCLEYGLREALQFGMPVDQALAHLWLGRLSSEGGMPSTMTSIKPNEHSAKAAEMFASFGMTYEKAMAEGKDPASTS